MLGKAQVWQALVLAVLAIIIGHFIIELIQQLFPYTMLFVFLAFIYGGMWRHRRRW